MAALTAKWPRPSCARASPECRAKPCSSNCCRSHRDAELLEQFLAGRNVASSVTAGSSLKFCLLASGEAHL